MSVPDSPSRGERATRIVRIPATWAQAAKWGAKSGATRVPVVVDWPELRLTPDQHAANGIAAANGDPEPHPDRSFFVIEIELPDPV